MWLAASALVLTGCSTHLAGTNDAALEYAILPDPSTGSTLAPGLVAAGVKSRLSSAMVPSDVDTTTDDHVRVVVDADVAGAVDELLSWRGGLTVWRLDPSYPLAPRDPTGVRPMSAPGASGEERWWQGTGEAIARMVHDGASDRTHAVFAERLATGEYRTRVALAPPVFNLGLAQAPISNIEPVEKGRALALTLSPEALSALAIERSAHPGEPVLLTRGTTTLVDVVTIDAAAATPLVLRFGDDVVAYTRANRAKLLLRSPVLPPLKRLSAGTLPSRWGLATACAVLPFLLSFAWLFFVRRFDRARPEPVWLVVATFGLGCLSVVPAALIEAGCSAASPWLDASIVTMGGQLWALPLAILVSTLVVGGAEEGAKFLGAWSLARHRHEFDEPVDGIVYGCAAALGFAAVENIKYFAFGRMSGVVIAMRAFETVPAHMFFGAIWGYAMGRALVSRKARVLPLFLLAAAAHGTFDALLSTDGTQVFAAVLVLGLAVAFVVMLRMALRHGAVPPARRAEVDAAPPTEPMPLSEMPRTYFRVGSPAASMACAVGMVLCAFGLTVLGTVYEMLHHRVNLVVVAISALLLGLFGLAAWGLSATIPLDVAVDAQGITFAGALTAWPAILSSMVEQSGARAFVRLETLAGAVRIGPTDTATAGAVVASIRAARG
jgi:RsiW-degrading membrane proteinase PrsW (M82 family)